MRSAGLSLAGAAASRVGQLALLLYLHLYGGFAGSVAVVVLSAGVAAQTLLDPGLTLLLSANERYALHRRTLWWATVTQFLVGVAAAGAGVLLALSSWTDLAPGDQALIAALLLVSCAEAAMRVARIAAMHQSRWLRYGLPELEYALIRLVAVAALESTGRAVAAGLVAVLTLLALVRGGAVFFRHSEGDGVGYLVLMRQAFPIGASSTVAAGYSQLQVPLIAALASPGVASAFAIAVRLVQASEIIPATIAQIRIPAMAGSRATREAETTVRRALMAVAVPVGAALAAGGFVMAGPAGSGGLEYYLAVLALSLPFKYANYVSVAALVAYRRAGQRLRTSALVAVVGLPVLAVAAAQGALVLCFATVALEALLFAVLMSTLGRNPEKAHEDPALQRALLRG